MGFFEDIGNGLKNFWQDITGITASNNAANAIQDGTAQMQAQLKPYADAGLPALEMQKAMSGSLGPEAQAQAYDNIRNSAGFQDQLRMGENSILSNASATGGLRGGNTQAAMGQFAPALLNQAIGQQYSQLGGLTSIGQNAAAGVGNAGMEGANAQAANYLNQYTLGKDLVFDVAGMGLKAFGVGGYGNPKA